MASEFDIIARFFTRHSPQAILGVGDDAALIVPGNGTEVVVSTDMLVEGTHFLPNTNAEKLGWKALAVNVSDLAAMGADPRWATLSLSLPKINESWLADFSKGFFECAERFGVDLIGGDTTRGPLNISITIMGEVPHGMALRRSAAQSGDDIWVTGRLGNAALGLAALKGEVPADGLEECIAALHTPQPRIELGIALRGTAHAAIDISDGLMADLGHILKRSRRGADIRLNDIPRSASISSMMRQPLGMHCLLAGGDDYELCFTAPKRHDDRIVGLRDTLNIPIARIGSITSTNELRLLDGYGKPIEFDESGYDHFAAT
ncbi:MAG TPA: thiamine-phosphate kinase [Methylophilaceae bacterium]